MAQRSTKARTTTARVAAIAGLTTFAVLSLTQAPAADDAAVGGLKVALPADYRQTFQKYDSFNRRTGNEIVELYANDITTRDLDKLDRMRPRLPVGSIVVREIHNAKLDGEGQPILDDSGNRVKGGLKEIQVMSKCEACGLGVPQELRTGNWQFAVFTPDGKLIADREITRCYECHKPMYKRDYVFSFKRLPRK